MGIRGSLDNSGIYVYHPSRRLDLHSPLVFSPTHANQPLDLIHNQYLTGIPSNDQTENISFYIYTHLPYCNSNDVLEILQRQLTAMHKQGHNTDPESLPELATIHYDMEPPPTEYDDEPIRSNTHILDPSVPYRYTVTLPTQSPPAYGLILLSSR